MIDLSKFETQLTNHKIIVVSFEVMLNGFLFLFLIHLSLANATLAIERAEDELIGHEAAFQEVLNQIVSFTRTCC